MNALDWGLVALGAALGAPLRYLLGHLFDAPHRLPWGTVGVNVAGSFLLGWFTGLAMSGGWEAFLGTGFCGTLTTFSSFLVQTHDRGPRLGAWNVLLTVVPSLVLCALGFAFAQP
ncbi:MAG TPA: CrcB family protein [Nocardioidaceae bacterium]|nr:CrcB family protein [Nocardioidaceae bacterium]